jgi:hypothetical protein
MEQMTKAMRALSLDTHHLVDETGIPTTLGQNLLDYFAHRAHILNNYVEPRLMEAEKAKRVFEELEKKFDNTHALIPMNKQKGEKKTIAYLTAIVNLIISSRIKNHQCDFNPSNLTTITRGGAPLRTLARRVDGAFPSTVNPIAIWEIKEYYHTTTFGSRVADGVYETLLDGLELEELREHELINVKHYLIIDAYYTWWTCGRSYLCRILDMLHMGYVDEVLFGYEVTERLPQIVDEWIQLAEKN